jgi:hypothetical protein
MVVVHVRPAVWAQDADALRLPEEKVEHALGPAPELRPGDQNLIRDDRADAGK